MKTYIVMTASSFIAVHAANKAEAFDKVKTKYSNARKSSVMLSAVHIDYVSCEKVY